MPTDEQKRNDFVVYLKQLKREWTIDREAEKDIILAILRHKGDKLDTYIAYFKAMVRNMTTDTKSEPDTYSANHPVDGKCVVSFVGANVTTQDYTSNYAFRLFFSRIESRIYKFELWR